MTCAREGCNRQARGDEFCSVYCCRRHYALLARPPEDPKERANRMRRIRRLKKKHGASYVEVENTDAMTHRLPGSWGTGKRQ